MIHHGKKIFLLVLLCKTNVPFIVTHVKKIFLVDTWVDGMLLATVILKDIQFIIKM